MGIGESNTKDRCMKCGQLREMVMLAKANGLCAGCADRDAYMRSMGGGGYYEGHEQGETMAAAEEQQLYRDAVKEWGVSLQMVKATEECGELITAVAQLIAGRVEPEEVAEEIADVEIMCAQLREMIGHDLVDQAKAAKLDRLRMRIADNQGNRAAPEALARDIAGAWRSGGADGDD